MKTTGLYPDWVDQYRGNGRSVKKRKNGFALYSCTSVYVKGGKPKSVQKYLGMITEKDGFIPKAVPYTETIYLEYALSKLIYLNYSASVKHSLGRATDDLVRLGIISFVFGGVSLYFLQSSALTCQDSDALYDYSTKISPVRIRTAAKKISSLLEDTISDEMDRLTIINGLRLAVIPKDKPVPDSLQVPEPVASLLNKYGLIYGC